MTEMKVYMEVTMDVDGNPTEASKRLREQIKKLNCRCRDVDNKGLRYNVTDCKISNGIVKTQVPMNIDKIKMDSWSFD